MRSPRQRSDAVTQRQLTVAEPCDGLTVLDLLNRVALDRDLRPSTRICYLRCLTQLQIGHDELATSVTKERVEAAAWLLTNPNTRRNTLIASRSVFGFRHRIGKPV